MSLEEMWSSGEPDPERGHCVLSRTPGMRKLEEKWSGRALMVTVGGTETVVTVVVQCDRVAIRLLRALPLKRGLHSRPPCPRPRRQRREGSR